MNSEVIQQNQPQVDANNSSDVYREVESYADLSEIRDIASKYGHSRRPSDLKSFNDTLEIVGGKVGISRSEAKKILSENPERLAYERFTDANGNIDANKMVQEAKKIYNEGLQKAEAEKAQKTDAKTQNNKNVNNQKNNGNEMNNEIDNDSYEEDLGNRVSGDFAVNQDENAKLSRLAEEIQDLSYSIPSLASDYTMHGELIKEIKKSQVKAREILDHYRRENIKAELEIEERQLNIRKQKANRQQSSRLSMKK